LSSANRFGSAFVAAGQPVTVTVTSLTRISRQGSKSLSSLVGGDRLLIQARACKSDLATTVTTTATTTTTATVGGNAAVPALTALHIVAHPIDT
jgi:hypothetical protein